ncbi:ATP synthase epsilon chain [Desulfarculales bacterium]
MANKILLEVVTPDRLLLSKEVEVVVATSVEGEFAVLYGHVPFLASLAVGELKLKDGNNIDYASVNEGFAEVTGQKVTILTKSAELAREIDVDRARKARERAEQRLVKSGSEQINCARAEAALKRAMLRIKIVERSKAI